MSEVMKDEFLARKTLKELQTEFTLLVKAKFTPPYFEEENRKNVDMQIFSVWQEIKRRGDDS